MDITYNRLKKQVDSRHGEVTFDKLGEILVTCMEFVETSVTEVLTGTEKEEWVLEAIDKIWQEQSDRRIIIIKKKGITKEDPMQGDIEDLARQLIRQVCVASKGRTLINTDTGGVSDTKLKKTMSVRSTSRMSWKKK